MSRYRKSGGKNKRQKDRPASVHRQQPLGRLSHWYDHKPIVTVDQLHKYRRKEFGTCGGTAAVDSQSQQPPPPPPPTPPRPPISLSASPSFDTEYRCRFEPPYRTAEEMCSNRRHAAVPKDELQVEGDAEFSAEYAERYKDGPRERNIVARQGSHIGPFVCADDAAPEGMAFRSEQNEQFVPHPDGRRAENLRPSTGLRVDEAPMDGETEQMAKYRKYPTTPHPDAAQDGNEVTTIAGATTTVTDEGKSSSSASLADGGRRPQPAAFDRSMKEMVMTRDSGMLLGPARPSNVFGANDRRPTERPGSVKRPAFRLQVVDCCDSARGGGGGGGDATTAAAADAFVVLGNLPSSPPTPSRTERCGAAAAVPVNRWTKRRQRKMGGGARFFDGCGRHVRWPSAVDAGKTLQ